MLDFLDHRPHVLRARFHDVVVSADVEVEAVRLLNLGDRLEEPLTLLSGLLLRPERSHVLLLARLLRTHRFCGLVCLFVDEHVWPGCVGAEVRHLLLLLLARVHFRDLNVVGRRWAVFGSLRLDALPNAEGRLD